jgi:hypothetical protein
MPENPQVGKKQRDKNVIVLRSERVKSNQNASERISGKPLKNQL